MYFASIYIPIKSINKFGSPFLRHLLDGLGEVEIVKAGIGRVQPLRRDGVDDGAAEFAGQPLVVHQTVDFRHTIRYTIRNIDWRNRYAIR